MEDSESEHEVWAVTTAARDQTSVARGRAFLISRSVDGPGRWKSWVGGRKQKTKNRGGPGAQPSEPVPVEEKIQILTMEFHELDSKPKSRE